MTGRFRDMTLAEDIGSVEGLSNDQVSRMRLAFALGQNSAIFSQTQMADAKSATMLAMFGVVAAHVAGGGLSLPRFATAGLVALQAAVIGLCLLALLPRLAGKDMRRAMHRTNAFTWLALTGDDYSGDAHAEFLRRGQASELVSSVALANASAARVLLRKFAILRAAFILALVDIAAMLVLATWFGAAA